jgi:hypothetical protein
MFFGDLLLHFRAHDGSWSQTFLAAFSRLWRGLKEEAHRRVRFRRWVWKLSLALRQFLPSPEAPLVLVLIMAVDVVAEMDDIEDNDLGDREAADALIEMARDNITRH